jgi:tRNA A37 N6-isopentenylltransferase MiaA
MVDDLRRGIRQLAKRQRTWFRGLARRGIAVTRIGPEESEALIDYPWTGG